MTPRTLAFTAAAMAAFAANSVLCRAALGPGLVDAASFTTLRVASGAIALALLVRARGSSRPAPRDLYASAALFVYALGFSLAYVRIPAALGALLLFGAVQVTMVGRGLATGERPRPAEWLGLGLSVSGLLASLAAAPAAPPRVTAAGVLLAVLSGALASGLGYALWYAALRDLSATRAALVQLSVPPLAALGGVALLGEAVTLRLVLSAAAILGGIALSLAGGRR